MKGGNPKAWSPWLFFGSDLRIYIYVPLYQWSEIPQEHFSLSVFCVFYFFFHSISLLDKRVTDFTLLDFRPSVNKHTISSSDLYTSGAMIYTHT